jgi:hypothetical protein
MPRWLFSTLILLPFAAIAVFYFACESSIPSCKEHHKKEKQAQQEKDIPDYTIAVAIQYKSNPGQQKEPGASAHTECSTACSIVTKTQEDPVALFTLVLCVVVYFQCLFMIRQEFVLKESIDVAETSANAARDSVNVAQAGDRAYVFVESVSNNPQEWRSGVTPFTWEFRITNHGRTPALITEITAFATLSDGQPTATGWDNANAVYRSRNFEYSQQEKLRPGYVLSQGASSESFSRDIEREGVRSFIITFCATPGMGSGLSLSHFVLCFSPSWPDPIMLCPTYLSV